MSSGNMYIGNRASDSQRPAGGAICHFTITDNPDPQVGHDWSKFGQQLLLPQLDIA